MNAPAMTLDANQLQLQESVFEKLAKYLAMEIPLPQIAAALNLQESQVDRLVNDQRVLDKKAALETEQLETSDKLNRGWDAVEEEGLGTVLAHLAANPDPDFALRAASVANKAQRRGAGANKYNTIDVNTKATATVTLNLAFIDKLQNMQIGMEAVDKAAKRVDALPRERVEELMRQGLTIPKEGDEITF